MGEFTTERVEGRFRMLNTLAECDNWVFQRVTCPAQTGYEFERTVGVKFFGSDKTYHQLHGPPPPDQAHPLFTAFYFRRHGEPPQAGHVAVLPPGDDARQPPGAQEVRVFFLLLLLLG